MSLHGPQSNVYSFCSAGPSALANQTSSPSAVSSSSSPGRHRSEPFLMLWRNWGDGPLRLAACRVMRAAPPA